MEKDSILTLIREEVGYLLKKEPASKSHFLTVKGAADFLGLSKHTIYVKCAKGELPHMKRSKRLYFDREELVQYLKAGKREALENLENRANEFLLNKKGGK